MPQQSVLAADPIQEFQLISIPCTVHFFNRCPGHHRHHRIALADAGFLRNTAAVLGQVIKETPSTCHN